MAITFVNVNMHGDDPGHVSSVAVPAVPFTLAVGDLLVLVLWQPGNVASFTLPVGITPLLYVHDANASLIVGYRFVQAGDPTQWTISGLVTDELTYGAFAHRGVTAVDAIAVSDGALSGGGMASPSIATAGAGETVVAGWLVGVDGGGHSLHYPSPNPFAPRLAAGGPWLLGDLTESSAGTYGPWTAADSGAISDAWSSFVLALTSAPQPVGRCTFPVGEFAISASPILTEFATWCMGHSSPSADILWITTPVSGGTSIEVYGVQWDGSNWTVVTSFSMATSIFVAQWIASVPNPASITSSYGVIAQVTTNVPANNPIYGFNYNGRVGSVATLQPSLCPPMIVHLASSFAVAGSGRAMNAATQNVALYGNSFAGGISGIIDGPYSLWDASFPFSAGVVEGLYELEAATGRLLVTATGSDVSGTYSFAKIVSFNGSPGGYASGPWVEFPGPGDRITIRSFGAIPFSPWLGLGAGFDWITQPDPTTALPAYSYRYRCPIPSGLTIPTPTVSSANFICQAASTLSDLNYNTLGMVGFSLATDQVFTGDTNVVWRPLTTVGVAVDFGRNSDIGPASPTVSLPCQFGCLASPSGGVAAGYAILGSYFAGYVTPSVYPVLATEDALSCCPRQGITPPTRQFPRDDTQGISTARVRIGRSQPSSRQQSYRQGFRGTYT